jgi:hypothetical protein
MADCGLMVDGQLVDWWIDGGLMDSDPLKRNKSSIVQSIRNPSILNRQ